MNFDIEGDIPKAEHKAFLDQTVDTGFTVGIAISSSVGNMLLGFTGSFVGPE